MKRCFVIQPFDGADYDARFDDVLKPAIERVGLEAYRVDRDPSALIPIERIEREIEASTACLADISEDNPNVWFELGYAIAAQRPVCLICAKTRQRFPFDVQHRRIIRYGTGSIRDLDQLGQEVTTQLQVSMDTEAKLASISPTTVPGRGDMLAHELAALVIMASNIYTSDGANTYAISQGMDKAGFNDLATNLAIRGLLKRGYAELERHNPDDGPPYTIYRPTEDGMDALAGMPTLEMSRPKRVLRPQGAPKPPARGMDEDDIPF